MQTDPTQAGLAAQTPSIAAEYFGRPLEAATVRELAGELHVAVGDLVAAPTRADLADQHQRITSSPAPSTGLSASSSLLVRRPAGRSLSRPGAPPPSQSGGGRVDADVDP